MIKNVKHVQLNISIATVLLNMETLEYKCLCCNKIYHRKFHEKLIERFFNTYNFSNHDSNKSILLLQKGVFLMNIWMIGKNVMQHHYLKKKIFIVT